MVGDGVECWVRVIMVCCSCLTVFLGCICLIRVLVWCVDYA